MTNSSVRTVVVLGFSVMVICLSGCATQAERDAGTPELNEYNERIRMAEKLAGMAQLAMDKGNRQQAIDLYRESIEYSAEFSDVWNNLGLLLLEENDLQRAMSAFSMAAELDPADPRAFYNMGITNMRAQWAEDAIDDFKKALEISPSYLPALRGAIQAADLLGRAEYEDLDRVRRALLAEHDERWRAYFERQRYLIQARLKSAKSPGSGGSRE